MNGQPSAAQRNRGVLKAAAIACGAAFLFGFAMVPLYRIACEHVFGIKLAEGAASKEAAAAFAEDTSRTINVQFVANVNSKLPWVFTSEAPSVDVPWFQRSLDAELGAVQLRRACVVPNSKLAYLARLAFGDGDYRVFYNDLAGAIAWLQSDPGGSVVRLEA